MPYIKKKATGGGVGDPPIKGYGLTPESSDTTPSAVPKYFKYIPKDYTSALARDAQIVAAEKLKQQKANQTAYNQYVAANKNKGLVNMDPYYIPTTDIYKNAYQTSIDTQEFKQQAKTDPVGTYGGLALETALTLAPILKMPGTAIAAGETLAQYMARNTGKASKDILSKTSYLGNEAEKTLYRIEGTGSKGNIADNNLKGQWFTDDKTKALSYLDKAQKSGGEVNLVTVKIPVGTSERFMAKNNDIVKANSKIDYEPLEDYIIPLDYSNRKVISLNDLPKLGGKLPSDEIKSIINNKLVEDAKKVDNTIDITKASTVDKRILNYPNLIKNPKYVYRTTWNPKTVQGYKSDEIINNVIKAGKSPITSTTIAKNEALEPAINAFGHASNTNVGLSTSALKNDALGLVGQADQSIPGYYVRNNQVDVLKSQGFGDATSYLAKYKVNPNSKILDASEYNKLRETLQNKGFDQEQIAKTLKEYGFSGVKKFENSDEIQWLNPKENLSIKKFKKLPSINTKKYKQGGFIKKMQKGGPIDPPLNPIQSAYKKYLTLPKQTQQAIQDDFNVNSEFGTGYKKFVPTEDWQKTALENNKQEYMQFAPEKKQFLGTPQSGAIEQDYTPELIASSFFLPNLLKPTQQLLGKGLGYAVDILNPLSGAKNINYAINLRKGPGQKGILRTENIEADDAIIDIGRNIGGADLDYNKLIYGVKPGDFNIVDLRTKYWKNMTSDAPDINGGLSYKESKYLDMMGKGSEHIWKPQPIIKKSLAQKFYDNTLGDEFRKTDPLGNPIRDNKLDGLKDIMRKLYINAGLIDNNGNITKAGEEMFNEMSKQIKGSFDFKYNTIPNLEFNTISGGKTWDLQNTLPMNLGNFEGKPWYLDKSLAKDAYKYLKNTDFGGFGNSYYFKKEFPDLKSFTTKSPGFDYPIMNKKGGWIKRQK